MRVASWLLAESPGSCSVWCRGSEGSLLAPLLTRSLILSDQGPYLLTSPDLNPSFTPNAAMLEVKASTYELGGLRYSAHSSYHR